MITRTVKRSIPRFLAGCPSQAKLWLVMALLIGATIPSWSTSGGCASGSVPTLPGEVRGNDIAANCGVNVTAFALKFFRKPCNLPQVASQLHVGGDWEQAVDMLRIKQALLEAGMRVAAYKGAGFTDISTELAKHPRRSLAIIFLKNDIGRGIFGHYMVLLDGGAKGLFVVDIGGSIGWVSLTDLHNRLGPIFSGLVMFVRPGGAPAATHVYPLDSKQIVLNAGEIASGPGMLHIPFLLKNTLPKPIGISSARGTCYCFRGASVDTPDHKIAPGKTGKITLKFKRDVIGIGNIEREVLFQFTNDPGQALRVVIHAHITATHPPIQLTWYPSQIDIGTVRHRKELAGEEFTVLTPKGETLGLPVSSSKEVSVIALASPGGKPESDDFGRTVHNYVIDLANLPNGFVDDKIIIKTTDKHVPKIVIPISGEVEK